MSAHAVDRDTVRGILLHLLAEVPADAKPVGETPIQGAPLLAIDGELAPSSSGASFDVENPASGEVVGEAADADLADLDRALASARRAFDTSTWSRDHELRAHCLCQLQAALADDRETLRRDLVAEIGCAVRMTYGDQLDRPIEKLGFYADLAATHSYETAVAARDGNWLFREPIGVVSVITPWNIPVELNLAKVGAALAAGCTVVLKPSPLSPWSGAHLGRLVVERTDFPPGVLNVLTSSSNEVAAALTTDPRVDAVAFTGSTATGRAVMAAAAGSVKRVLLELGGKAATVILDDTDLDAVVPLAAALVCFNAGQSCILPSRLLVPREQLDRCVELAVEGLASVPVGDPTEPDVFMGPLISEQQRARVEEYVEQGKAEGARLVLGGARRDDLGTGYFFEPTLFADVDCRAAIAQEEIFGPVLSIVAYDDEDDAVAIANDTVYGLAGYVWGGDPDRAIDVARRLRAGMVSVNGGTFIGADLPFGGRGQSGFGREWGVAGFEEFLDLKSVGLGAPPA